MVIYTNEDNMICAIEETDRTDLTMYEIDDDTFAGKCSEFIFGYKYEPTYEIEYNYDGEFPEAVTDEDGNPVYVLDENGNKNVVGIAYIRGWILLNYVFSKQNMNVIALEKKILCYRWLFVTNTKRIL